MNYYWGDQDKESEIGGSCSNIEEIRNAYSVLFGKTEARRFLGSPRYSFKSDG
jgi:hypothetical protein